MVFYCVDGLGIMESKNKLKRGLSTRHIRFMAWVQQLAPGCFTVRQTPSKWRSERVVGLYYRWYRGVYHYAALGEMSVHNPAASSFSRYAQKTSARWQVTLPAGPIALKSYCRHRRCDRFWYLYGCLVPDVPHWIWVLSVVLIICAVNLIA